MSSGAWSYTHGRLLWCTWLQMLCPTCQQMRLPTSRALRTQLRRPLSWSMTMTASTRKFTLLTGSCRVIASFGVDADRCHQLSDITPAGPNLSVQLTACLFVISARFPHALIPYGQAVRQVLSSIGAFQHLAASGNPFVDACFSVL